MYFSSSISVHANRSPALSTPKYKMKVLNLITISLFCMSFLVNCFFALMLFLLVDNIRVEEVLYYSWNSEARAERIPVQELTVRLKRIEFEIEKSFLYRGYRDVSVMHEVYWGDSRDFFVVNFYVKYDVSLGTKLTSGESKEDLDYVAGIVRDKMGEMLLNDSLEAHRL